MASFFGTKINPRDHHRSQIKFYLILIPLAVLMVLPILFIFNHAFKPQNELFAFPPRFFVREPTLDNFIELGRVASQGSIPLSRYILNSLLVTVTGVLLTIIITGLAAYALAKLRFRGKKLLFEINTIALMFVSSAVAITRYLVISKLGLVDSFLVHILPNIAMPVSVFLFKQFMDQTPDELIDAGKVDGASEMQILYHIVRPIIKPAISTVAIMSFLNYWADSATSFTYINNESKRTLAFFLTSITSQANVVAGQGMAAASSLILFLPALIFFIFSQSKVMDTMAHAGIK
jgi:ABC-type glycerol-3-phosphate transport system permease component